MPFAMTMTLFTKDSAIRENPGGRSGHTPLQGFEQ